MSSGELRGGVLSAGLANSAAEVDEILLRGDADGSGDLTLPEFLACFGDVMGDGGDDG